MCWILKHGTIQFLETLNKNEIERERRNDQKLNQIRRKSNSLRCERKYGMMNYLKSFGAFEIASNIWLHGSFIITWYDHRWNFLLIIFSTSFEIWLASGFIFSFILSLRLLSSVSPLYHLRARWSERGKQEQQKRKKKKEFL